MGYPRCRVSSQRSKRKERRKMKYSYLTMNEFIRKGDEFKRYYASRIWEKCRPSDVGNRVHSLCGMQVRRPRKKKGEI